MEIDVTVPWVLDVAFVLLIVADIAGVIHAFRSRPLWLAIAWTVIIVCMPIVGIVAYGVVVTVESRRG